MTHSNEEAHAPAKPKKKRRLLRALGWTLGVILVLGLGAGGFGWYTVQRSFPQTTGTLQVAGLEHDVTVQRASSGIPTITAESSQDLFFAQGFVHAQDRFWEMDFRRHLTAGRLSELFGESQLGTDKFLRSLGWHEVAKQEVEALQPETRAYFEAYAAGVNAYMAERKGSALSLEYAALGLQNSDYSPEPWTAVDSIAWLKAMAWDLRTNIEDETTRAIAAQELDAAQLSALYPGYPFDEHPVIVDKNWALELPAATLRAKLNAASSRVSGALSDALGSSTLSDTLESIQAVDEMITSQSEGVGSNSWVVAGEHTETGSPLLANDPHLGASLPSVWTQMQLRCSTVSEACPFEVAGFSFSGLPGIVIGHNDQVAWGFTNLTTDVADLYIERVDGDSYWQDGKKHDVTVRKEVIKVAGGEDVPLEVRSTAHGPIISGLTPDFTAIAEQPIVGTGIGADEAPTAPSNEASELSGEYAVSLRWTALDAGNTGEGIFALNTAKNFDDFRAAAALFDVPAQNLIYADTKGNIGYQAPGKLPIRGAGDGWLPQPGWDSAYDWQGYIPFEDQPMLYNPDSGYIVTANNAIVSDSYPYFLSRDWDYGYRAARIAELLDDAIAEGPITSQKMADIQMDNQMPAAKSLQRAYDGLFDTLTVEEQGVVTAVNAMLKWNGQNDPDSAEAAYANVLWNQVTKLMLSGKATDISRDDQSRLATFFAQQLEQPDSEWWQNEDADITSQQGLLVVAAQNAYDELTEAQGADQSKWNWGKLHAITLTHGTFGSSGIAPLEWLFNRGPYEVGGGSGVVNATGWALDEGYATTNVPSMRMVIDPSDWDASTWIHLTGASGHAFNPHYTDQTHDWATGVQRPWAFTPDAVKAAAKDTLTLTPTAG